ncbi:hypothetical protein TREES_T100010938 [Tupaia chinensis]|uniref:Uncharacterized protein n=1 Tax=Tupaia chinensis TaxID=246437 RepID=L9JPJ7_TUPCH|nr:hypothetical protein TREES_T100010938 [Tupaia chinensis]
MLKGESPLASTEGKLTSYHIREVDGKVLKQLYCNRYHSLLTVFVAGNRMNGCRKIARRKAKVDGITQGEEDRATCDFPSPQQVLLIPCAFWVFILLKVHHEVQYEPTLEYRKLEQHYWVIPRDHAIKSPFSHKSRVWLFATFQFQPHNSSMCLRSATILRTSSRL